MKLIKNILRRKWIKKLFCLCLVASAVFIYFKWERISAELFYNLRFEGTASTSTPRWNNTAATLPKINKTLLVGLELKPGCRLPQLDAWDPHILPYVTEIPEVVCPSRQSSLLFTERSKILVNTTALGEAGYNRDSLVCKYRYIRWKDTDAYEFLPEETLEGNEKDLDPSYNSVWARCTLSRFTWLDWFLPELLLHLLGIEVFQNVLLYVPKINKLEARGKDQFSVFIFTIDAMSLQNFHRSLPKTAKLLQAEGSILFDGLNKVGYNSYPNIMALLSGESGGEWDGGRIDGDGKFSNTFPNSSEGIYYIDKERQPNMFNRFEENGYTTVMMEDMSMWSIFHRTGTIGMRKPLASIYYRPGMLAIEEEEWGYLRSRLVGKFGAYACLQNDLIHKPMLGVVKNFLSTYSSSPAFGYIHLSSYLHNDLNMAKLYDDDLHDMIRDVIDSGELDDTFFILMGDHGFQRGEFKFTLTEQGRMEDKLPLFHLLPPQNFKSRFPDLVSNLVSNSHTLISFFDVNQFLRDVLAMGVNSTSQEMFRNYEGHGLSLFSEIPPRTCSEASIPEDYCACLDGVSKIDPDLPEVNELAVAILNDINEMVEDLTFCGKLKLKHVNDATVRRGREVSLVTLQVEVVNRGAVFEIGVKIKDEKLESCKVIRLDWYSSTSECVPTNMGHIRPYCLCQDTEL